MNTEDTAVQKQMLEWAAVADQRDERFLATTLREAVDKIDGLTALAKLGRWCLSLAGRIEQFSPENCNAIEVKAVEFGLGTMYNMGTYELFIEGDSANVLDEGAE